MFVLQQRGRLTHLGLRHQIEYLVIAFDEETKNACLSLRQAEILEAISERGKLGAASGGDVVEESVCPAVTDGCWDRLTMGLCG